MIIVTSDTVFWQYPVQVYSIIEPAIQLCKILQLSFLSSRGEAPVSSLNFLLKNEISLKPLEWAISVIDSVVVVSNRLLLSIRFMRI